MNLSSMFTLSFGTCSFHYMMQIDKLCYMKIPYYDERNVFGIIYLEKLKAGYYVIYTLTSA